ncbi:MAG: type III secretion system translocon subunit SctB, partial [Candidatus Spyradenecus sp.]
GVSTSGSSSSSVFFNLYQLMVLLSQVAQELRDSTRDIREAESQALQASIQSQADQQRSAALFGMIGGAIVCAVQVVATGVGLSKQASAFKSQLSAQHQSGVSRAHADLQMAELQASPSDAARNYQTKVNQMGPQKANEVLSTFEGSQRAGEAYANSQAKVAYLKKGQEAATARQDLADAKTALETTTKQLSTEHSKLLAANEQLPKAQNELVYLQDKKAAVEAEIQQNPQAATAEKQTQLQSLNEKIDAKQAEIQQLQQNKADATAKIDQLQPQKAEQQAAVDQAQGRVTQAEQELEAMRQQNGDVASGEQDLTKAEKQMEDDRKAYVAALKSEASQARSTYEDALANNSPEAKELQQRAELAEAYAAKELSGILTGEEKSTAITDANNAYKQADALLTHSEKFQTAQYNSDRARAFNDLVGVLGNLGNTLIRGAADMMNAEATAMGADQKEAEEALEEIKDLFQGAGDLANAVLQLMQGVQQSENDSMQEAIRA